MRIRVLVMVLSFFCTAIVLQAQVIRSGDEALVRQIKQSEKKYKLIYIHCNYCLASQIRYPKVIKGTENNKDIEVFVISAQDSEEVAQYADTCRVKSKIYLINQKRKRRWVSFYNPIKATCKFLKKQFDINSDEMGASDFCILDKNNKVIAQTSWEMKDDEYFNMLSSKN